VSGAEKAVLLSGNVPKSSGAGEASKLLFTSPAHDNIMDFSKSGCWPKHAIIDTLSCISSDEGPPTLEPDSDLPPDHFDLRHT
jgi:hypothetical protein